MEERGVQGQHEGLLAPSALRRKWGLAGFSVGAPLNYHTNRAPFSLAPPAATLPPA